MTAPDALSEWVWRGSINIKKRRKIPSAEREWERNAGLGGGEGCVRAMDGHGMEWVSMSVLSQAKLMGCSVWSAWLRSFTSEWRSLVLLPSGQLLWGQSSGSPPPLLCLSRQMAQLLRTPLTNAHACLRSNFGRQETFLPRPAPPLPRPSSSVSLGKAKKNAGMMRVEDTSQGSIKTLQKRP